MGDDVGAVSAEATYRLIAEKLADRDNNYGVAEIMADFGFFGFWIDPEYAGIMLDLHRSR